MEDRKYNIKIKKILIVYFMVFSFIMQETPHVVKEKMHLGDGHQRYHIWVNSYHSSGYFRSTFFRFSKHVQKLSNFIDYDYLTRKNTAVAMISDCTSNHTILKSYLQELKKYFPVDVYRQCFDKYPKKQVQERMCNNYKFYISFENSICEDYITEKYSAPIDCGSIPIVMTPKINLKHLIPGSYINVFDFASPKRLGEHLANVSKSFKLYLEYFKWKQYYRVESTSIENDVCKMVEAIDESQTSTRMTDHLIHEIFNGRKCMNARDIYEIIFRIF
ncbi:Alpha-(1,3)-fucosyltransferase 6 [Thelohanellus kitauei]|uniref:Fucosyltransferase n=1 Tax=Thelohanellus kitauei TaxID=669202 RepID=A0A0C2ISE7_THEKT|nr:Alpha-(1,3)-fucosyltransferase 6 [Thelohanellus kitauei]